MPSDSQVDAKSSEVAAALRAVQKQPMTAFVESCVETAADSAVAAERRARFHGRPHARRLLKLLADKKNILVTTHINPDPDALAACIALTELLKLRLSDAKVSTFLKGKIGGGINEVFTRQNICDFKQWNDSALKSFDAIILLDVQPTAAHNPLPDGIEPLAVVDHHRSRGRRPKLPFYDVRPEVGATSSIIFSYFMETDTDIPSDLGATLLFAIETDLAGAAATPGELDNLALSSLTLLADTHKLYEMRYVDLPQSSYVSFYRGIGNAIVYDNAVASFLEEVESQEQPAVLADFLLRYNQVQWSLVTAVFGDNLILSLRTSSTKLSAAQLIRRLLRKLGEGGGHRTKAGGYIPLENGSPTEIERIRTILRRRYLRALGINVSRGQRLVTA